MHITIRPHDTSAGSVRRPARQLLMPALVVFLIAGCHGSEANYSVMPSVPAPPVAPSAVVYLVGDAGADTPGRSLVLGHVRADIERTSGRSRSTPIVVLFLGDNIYEVGARAEYREEDLAHLVAQVDALGDVPNARGIFLPGNHDWAKGADYPLAVGAINLQRIWLHELGERAMLLPSDGCPGPTAVDVGPSVRFLLIDTEWLLRRPVDDCGSFDAFFDRLRDELASAGDRRVILAAHHPLASGGPHGGNVGLFEHGPMIYFVAVQAGLGVQDITSGRYSSMIDGFERAIRESGNRPLLFASGHDHSLQVIRTSSGDRPHFQLVSGSGARRTPADRIEGTRYARGDYGYMRLDLGESETVVTVFAVDESMSSVGPVFGCTLETDGAPAECPEAPFGGSR